MKTIIEKLIDMVGMVLPFLKKKNAKEIREFSELVVEQYEFLMGQVDKMLKDYFELSDRVKEMHTEIFCLRQELGKAMEERCGKRGCRERE